MTTLWTLRDQFIGMFTTDLVMVEMIITAWPLLILFTLFDATSCVSGSFIGATGKQCTGALLTSTGYFLFGLPTAYYFAIHLEWGIRGIWIGPLVACVYLTLMYNILVMCINWPSLYNEINERREVENA